jgi:hypothetical protein
LSFARAIEGNDKGLSKLNAKATASFFTEKSLNNEYPLMITVLRIILNSIYSYLSLFLASRGSNI